MSDYQEWIDCSDGRMFTKEEIAGYVQRMRDKGLSDEEIVAEFQDVFDTVERGFAS